MKIVFGIDLGTTNTCIAKYQNKSFHVLDIDGDKVVPSVVGWDGENFLVGRKALNFSKIAPMDTVRSVKRFMGTPQKEITLGNKILNPLEISAKILGHIKERVWEQYQLQVQDVVITVPAYFNDVERRSTLLAGQMAGLNVLRIMNEPTAASLVYEIGDLKGQKRNPEASLLLEEEKSEEKWIVYDLGGGTFDVTILVVKKNGQIKEVLSSSGNSHLGGDDFDLKLVYWLVDFLKKRHDVHVIDDKKTMAFLQYLAEQIKIKLSTEAEVKILEILEWQKQSIDLNLIFTREDFEELIVEDIESTIVKTREALYEANCKKTEMDRLILVGGSSKIPLVRKKLNQEFSLDAVSYIDADCSVALGASIQAAISSSCEFERVIIDVASHTVGIACLGEEDYVPMMQRQGLPKNQEQAKINQLIDQLRQSHPLTFVPIIKRNTKLPAKFVEVFYTAADNQTEVEIPIYQGESTKVRENIFIGSFFVKLKPSPEGTPIKVGYEYDLNGTIKIFVEAEGAERPQYFTMDVHQTAEMNMDSSFIHYLDLQMEGVEEPEISAGQKDQDSKMVALSDVTNLLIQKVEEKIVGLKIAEELTYIHGLLKEYKHFLSLNHDEKLDEIEDHLYNWMEKQEG